MRRKLSTARSSVEGPVKCAYVERNATNRDQSRSNTSRSLTAQHQGSLISVCGQERPRLLSISLPG